MFGANQRPPAATPRDHINGAEQLLRRIQEHAAEAEAAAKACIDGFKTHPHGKGNAARDFTPINPLNAWLDITDEPYLQAFMLVKKGQITTMDLNGRHYARPAP
ncbi:MAG: hypothetical protein AAGI24_04115 [Pseudomonadota bacterium]